MIGWLSRLLLRRRHLHWVLADQILVSGCNFVIAILYARSLGPAGFGTYALITVAQQYFVSVSVSLIGNPLITAAPHVQDTNEQRHMIESSFAAQLLVSTGLALLAAVGMSIYLFVGAPGFSGFAVLGLAASSFALPLLEWCRRLCFLHRDGPSLFRFDVLTYLPVVIAACALVRYGWLTLDMAVSLWGASSVTACLYGVYHLRMPCCFVGARAFMVRHWRASRDFVVSFQAQWLGSQGIVYLAAPVVGTSGVGAYRSIGGLLGFTNALGTTLDNMLPLRFAEAYRKGGDPALRKYTVRFGVALTGLLVLLLVPVGIFAEPIVGVLLGDAYVAYSNILWVQGISVTVIFASRIALYHERARLHTRRIALSAILGTIVSIFLVINITTVLGPVGLAWSTALGGTISLIYLSFCIFRDARSG